MADEFSFEIPFGKNGEIQLQEKSFQNFLTELSEILSQKVPKNDDRNRDNSKVSITKKGTISL